jgi:hypothetical protein
MKYWERISGLSRERGFVCWRDQDGVIRTVGRYSGGSPDRRGTASSRYLRVLRQARTDVSVFAARLHRSGRFAADCW